MSFDFATAGRIVFGRGRVAELGGLVQGLGRRVLIVSGHDPSRSLPAERSLATAGAELEVHRVDGEPTVEDATAGAEHARRFGAELVVAIGGGSALDLGKAVAALAPNPGPTVDYLEVIGAGRTLERPALPSVAIPTTAGTGSEVTKNAVLASTQRQVKVSLRDASMLPRVALVDPELTVGLPPAVTASTGLDALTQCIEPYLSCFANPLTDGLALEGIRRGARALRRAVRDGGDIEAREDLCLCSLFGGLALANAKLGAVHGIAGPFGGMFPSPHGAVCARLLPFVLEANLRALRERAPTHPALARFGVVGRALTGELEARAEDGIAWVHELCAELRIPPLSRYGMSSADIPALVEKSARASSMKGNPLPLTEAELQDLLEGAA